MRYLLIFILAIAGTRCAAQGAPQSDSVVQYRELSAALTENSQLTNDKRRFEYLPVRMAKDDIALIVYSSSDYVTALAIRDSAGREGLKEDNGTFFKTIGSKIILPFKAEETGQYYLIFTSKEPGKTGNFKVKLYYYNNANNSVTNTSSFCEKIKYIVGNAWTNFEFLKGAERKGGFITKWATSIQLIPDATNEITDVVGNSYNCVWDATSDLNALQKKFDDLLKQMESCLSGAEKKVYTESTVSDYEKKDFVRKVELARKGKTPNDLSATHGLSGVEYRIVLQIEKSGTEQYKMKMRIE